jgi:hypothetical protein
MKMDLRKTDCEDGRLAELARDCGPVLNLQFLLPEISTLLINVV